MSDVSNNPIVARIEQLLAEVREAEQRVKEQLSDLHTASKTLQADRKAFLDELKEWRSNVRDDVKETVQEALDAHAQEIQDQMDAAARRSLGILNAGMELMVQERQREMAMARGLPLPLVTPPRGPDTRALPGLKRGRGKR